MKISMLMTQPGSRDGIQVATYQGGHEYDLTKTAGERKLAAAFVAAGFATETGATPSAPDALADPVTPERAKPGRKPRQ